MIRRSTSVGQQLMISNLILDDFGITTEEVKKAPAVTKRKESLLEKIQKVNNTEDLLKKADIKRGYSTAKLDSKK
jgi:hypothetical protein